MNNIVENMFKDENLAIFFVLHHPIRESEERLEEKLKKWLLHSPTLSPPSASADNHERI